MECILLMIESEFIIVLLASIIGFIAFFIVTIKSLFRSPIRETKIFAVGFAQIYFIILFYLPSTILYSSSGIDIFTLSIMESSFVFSWGFFFYQLAYIIGANGLVFIIYSLLLPNFNPTYKSITLISIGTTIITGSGFIVFFSVLQEVKDNVILIKYVDPLAYIGLAILGILGFYAISYRIKEITKGNNNKKSSFANPLFIGSFAFLIIVIIVGVTMATIFPGMLPSYSFLLPMSIALLLFSLVYSKETEYLFFTPVTIEAFVVLEQNSGLPLYSISNEEQESGEDLIAGIFQALNISLTETVQSKKGLEQINFGDKSVLIVPGKYISSIFFVSHTNFITASISKHITKLFEREFKDILKKEDVIHDQSVFYKFKSIYDSNMTYFINEA